MNSLCIFEYPEKEPILLRPDLPDCVVLNVGDYIMFEEDYDEACNYLIIQKEYDVKLRQMTYWME